MLATVGSIESLVLFGTDITLKKQTEGSNLLRLPTVRSLKKIPFDIYNTPLPTLSKREIYK